MNPVIQYFKSRIGKEVISEPPCFTEWLKGILKDVEEGELTIEFTVRSEMANPVGFLHGGVQNAIIDDVIGMAVATLGHETFFLSLNLHVDYLSNIKVGKKVIAKARIIRKGSQIINVQCELFDIKGKIISRGTSNLLKSTTSAFQALKQSESNFRNNRKGF
jgi:uncharacterized protein (TIGR00369 family)